MAIPMILAQFVNVLYSIVDRIYISRMPGDAFWALTGVGICLPIIAMVMAFANLFGMGGAPLCSIERGRGNYDEAEKIMGNSFIMLLISGIILTIVGLLLKKPMLYMFGASDQTFPYADEYVTIYLLGTIFVLISLGMNHFINAQGFGKIGMLTVALGAVTNIILDPIFIFLLDLGVRGAALATIISQFLSALWVIQFLTGKKAILTLKRRCFHLELHRVRLILGLGVSGFVMQFTNSLVAIAFNATLQQFGGDLYVGIMIVLNSIREFLALPVMGLGNGAQPVMGFNYGAREYARVKSCIKFTTLASLLITIIPWLLLESFPGFFIAVFNNDPQVLQAGIPMLRLFYAGFIFMAFQHAGQSTFVALGRSKHAIFFSTFRKVMLVLPLTLLLPRLCGLGSTGVFLAEPISEVIGGTACFVTMILTVWRELKEE
ncbi:MAG TPA: MATE family efflux transporter [Firmicutes bacterium]|nr:MATE family efflux transporter [Bacillota bacterium]